LQIKAKKTAGLQSE